MSTATAVYRTFSGCTAVAAYGLASATRKRGGDFDGLARDGHPAQIFSLSRRHKALVNDDANKGLQMPLAGQKDILELMLARKNLERCPEIGGIDMNLRLGRIDHYVEDKVVRRLSYSNIQNVQGIWTARLVEMADLRRGSRTRLTLEKLQYNLPLKNDDFTLQALRRQ